MSEVSASSSQLVVPEIGDMAVPGRALLAVVLGLAAWAKLRDWGGFRRVMAFLMPQGPATAVALVAAIVIGCEALLVGLLVAGVGTEVAGWGAVGFFCAATSALLVLRKRGYQEGCACFGNHGAKGPAGLMDLFRNAVLIAGAFAVAQPQATVQPLWALPVATIALAVATTAGVLLSYGTVVAVVAVRTTGAHPRSDAVEALVRSQEQAGDGAT